MKLSFAVSRSSLALFATLLFAGCAPSATPTTAPTTGTVTKPPAVQSESERALDRAMFRQGEIWSITALSPDGKTKRTHNVEITGVAEYDADATEVYINAKSGPLAALTYYDPDTDQQAVEVFLDSSKDPNMTWCDFNKAQRGAIQLRGLSYFGVRSKLNAALQNKAKLGTCTLQKVK